MLVTSVVSGRQLRQDRGEFEEFSPVQGRKIHLGGLLQFSDENYRLFQIRTFLATEGLY